MGQTTLPQWYFSSRYGEELTRCGSSRHRNLAQVVLLFQDHGAALPCDYLPFSVLRGSCKCLAQATFQPHLAEPVPNAGAGTHLDRQHCTRRCHLKPAVCFNTRSLLKSRDFVLHGVGIPRTATEPARLVCILAFELPPCHVAQLSFELQKHRHRQTNGSCSSELVLRMCIMNPHPTMGSICGSPFAGNLLAFSSMRRKHPWRATARMDTRLNASGLFCNVASDLASHILRGSIARLLYARTETRKVALVTWHSRTPQWEGIGLFRSDSTMGGWGQIICTACVAVSPLCCTTLSIHWWNTVELVLVHSELQPLLPGDAPLSTFRVITGSWGGLDGINTANKIYDADHPVRFFRVRCMD